jgi:hypothetical protein
VAQSSGDPASEDARNYWSSRIRDYIASGKAAQHVQEGFNSARGFGTLNLEEFKKRETRRKRLTSGQGELPQGSTPGQAVDDDADAALICVWCGKECLDEFDLEEHEDECDPR